MQDLVKFCGENPSQVFSPLEERPIAIYSNDPIKGPPALHSVIYDSDMELVSGCPEEIVALLQKSHPNVDFTDPRNLSQDLMYMNFPRQGAIYRKQFKLCKETGEANWAEFPYLGTMMRSYMMQEQGTGTHIRRKKPSIPRTSKSFYERGYVRSGASVGKGDEGIQQLYVHIIARHAKDQMNVSTQLAQIDVMHDVMGVLKEDIV